QNATGIDGSGSVNTSSPGRPTTAVPSSSNASTRAPSIAPGMRPATTGRSGEAPTNAVHTSVPPLIELSKPSDVTASYTHRKPAAGSGAPVEPTPRNDRRSQVRMG